METAMRIFQTIVGSLICYALSGPVISISHAQSPEGQKICEISSIKDAFLPPNFKATDEQIKQIRLDLKKSDLDPDTEDGELGEKDYAAFAKLCGDNGIEEDFISEIEKQPKEDQEGASVEYRKSLADKLVKLLLDSPNTGGVLTDEPKICESDSIKKAFSDFEGTEEYIERIQLQLMISGFDPGKIDGILGKVTYAAFAKLCADNKTEEKLKEKVEEQPEEKQAETEETFKQSLAEKLVELLFYPEINMIGAGCGCSRDFSRTVYGVYPYLRTGGGAMEVNFDLLDRIGFYGLVLDQSGEIQNDLGWNNKNEDEYKNVANFIYEAHRHRVKADVSFVAKDWTDWGFAEMSRAATSVAKIANLKFRSKNDPLRWIALAPSHSVDGVNLIFDMKGTETSDDGKDNDENISDTSKKLHKIVRHVSEKLKDIGSEAKINIVLGLDLSVVKDLSQVKDDDPYNKLREILKHDNPAIDKILVTLKKMDDAPAANDKNLTADESKKELSDAEIKKQEDQLEESKRRVNQILMLLRWQIEKAYAKPQGLPDFETVIRKILPIVMIDEASHKPLNGKDSQFEVDLAYLEDNFGGVALTPLPLKSAANAKDISEALIAKFGTGDSDSAFCQGVCSNRVFVYVFLGLLLFLMIAFRLASMVNCRVSSVYQQRLFMNLLNGAKLIFLAGLLITFNCDPDPPGDTFTVVGFALLLWAPQFYGYFSRQNRPALP